MKVKVDMTGVAYPIDDPSLPPMLVAHATTDDGLAEFLLGGDDPLVMSIAMAIRITGEPVELEMEPDDPRIVSDIREVGKDSGA